MTGHFEPPSPPGVSSSLSFGEGRQNAFTRRGDKVIHSSSTLYRASVPLFACNPFCTFGLLAEQQIEAVLWYETCFLSSFQIVYIHFLLLYLFCWTRCAYAIALETIVEFRCTTARGAESNLESLQRFSCRKQYSPSGCLYCIPSPDADFGGLSLLQYACLPVLTATPGISVVLAHQLFPRGGL